MSAALCAPAEMLLRTPRCMHATVATVVTPGVRLLRSGVHFVATCDLYTQPAGISIECRPLKQPHCCSSTEDGHFTQQWKPQEAMQKRR